LDQRNSMSKTTINDSKADKANIPIPSIDQMADYWKSGKAMQLQPVVKHSGPLMDYTMIPLEQVEGQLMNKLKPKPVPGNEITMQPSLLSTESGSFQRLHPLNNICAHLYGVHMYNGDMARQLYAHHYCSHLNEDIRQCLVFRR